MLKKLLDKYMLVYSYDIIIMDYEDLKRWNLDGLEPIKLIPKL